MRHWTSDGLSSKLPLELEGTYETVTSLTIWPNALQAEEDLTELTA